jgi:hypothetical protein
MRKCAWLMVLLAAFCAGWWKVRADDGDTDGPRLPVVGRPELFDENDSPIGSFHVPVVRITPSDVQVEDPVTVSVRVEAAGPVQRPPRQLRLEKLPGFAEQFYVEYPNDPRFRPIDNRVWELTCTLKPRHVNVKAVPSFPFVFFTPGFVPPERGYQIQRTDSIPLVVRPRVAVGPSDVAEGADLPPWPGSLYEITEGAEVLRSVLPLSPHALAVIGAVCLICPPLAFMAWCLAWPRLFPGARARLNVRHSTAARSALAALGRPAKDGEIGQTAASIVAQYLRDRFELTAREPTPNEAQRRLETVGYDPGMSARASGFFRACDAARYAYLLPPEDLSGLARQLILALEAGPCPESVLS